MTSRKDFLTTVAAAAATPAAFASPAAAAATPKKPQPPLTFAFNRAAFEAVLQKPARHKQCFGATTIDGGNVLFGMNNTIAAYETYYDQRAAATQTVAVLYHGASILLALNDAFWNGTLAAYIKAGGVLSKDAAADVHSGKGNPYLHSLTMEPDDVSVESLVAKGSSFFVCHNAIKGFSGQLAGTLRQPKTTMHQRILEALVPGALAVPAGVMAINACQEAKFTYIAT